MKLAYCKLSDSQLEGIRERYYGVTDKLNASNMRKAIRKSLTILCSFCVGVDFSAIVLSKLFSTGGVINATAASVSKFGFALSDPVMTSAIQLFLTIFILTQLLQGSKLPTKQFFIETMKTIFMAISYYIVFLLMGGILGNLIMMLAQ